MKTMKTNDVVIVSAVRTPFGRFDDALKNVLSMDIGMIERRFNQWILD